MRRLGAVLAVVVASSSAVGGPVADGQPAPPSAHETPPGGILVSANPSRCYAPDTTIRVAAQNLMPGSSVQASSVGAVSVVARASSAGTAVIALVAPSGLPRGRSIEAHLITVDGTDALGNRATSDAAVVLGSARTCRRINPGR